MAPSTPTPPLLVLLTYQLPDEIRKIAIQGEVNEFDLNVFDFAAPPPCGKSQTTVAG